ncbi:MAG: AAA family ATPase [Sulfurovum sp.]|nr:AAA family ATPase [Sulfurovum sp.]
MQKRVRAFMKENQLISADIARGINVSPSMISQYFKGSYRGDEKGLEKKLEAYISNFSPYVEIEEKEIHRTRNVIIAHDILTQVQTARKTCIIYGVPGSGKTVMIKEFEKGHPEAIVIYTSVSISTRNVLDAICEKVGVQKGTPFAMQENLIKHFRLSRRSNNILIIDEAENMKTSTLETLRAIQDESGVAMALVGTHLLLGNLQGRGGSLLQLSSRINRKFEFQPLEDDEWVAMFGEVSEYIRTLTNNLRVAKNSIYDTALTYANSRNEVLDVKHIKMVLPTIVIPQ